MGFRVKIVLVMVSCLTLGKLLNFSECFFIYNIWIANNAFFCRLVEFGRFFMCVKNLAVFLTLEY